MNLPEEGKQAINQVIAKCDEAIGHANYKATFFLVTKLIVFSVGEKRKEFNWDDLIPMTTDEKKQFSKVTNFLDKIVIDRVNGTVKFSKSILTLFTLKLNGQGRIA